MYLFESLTFYWIETSRIEPPTSLDNVFQTRSIKSVRIDDLAVEIERGAIFPIFEATTEIAVAPGNETCV